MAGLNEFDPVKSTNDPFEMLQLARNMIAAGRARVLDGFRQSIGPLLDQMIQNPALIWANLESNDPNIRTAAIWVAIRHLRMLAEFREKCIALSITDCDEAVRLFALGLLREYDQGTAPDVGKHLAQIAESDHYSKAMREAAYRSLLVHCGRAGELLRAGTIVDEIQFPRDVDWKLVGQFTCT